MGKTMKFLDYYISDNLKNHGVNLTKTQMILLLMLERADGQPQHDLAFITNRDKASLARLLNTMEHKNLVARIPSKEDGRVNLIFITKHGKAVLESTRPILDNIIGDIQKGLSNSEIKGVIDVMMKIQKNINVGELVAMETK
jgi:DNA-binding MarR family transcriptional regulator